MKFIKFNFKPPFQGRTGLIRLDAYLPNKQVVIVDNDGLLENLIDAC